jgi:hypothetical protein
MAPTKAYLEKAQHAEKLLSLNPNLTPQELYEATGVSETSARRIKKAFARNVTISKNETEDLTDDNALPVDFQESPQPVGDEPTHESIVAHGKKLLRGMLGMRDETEEKKSVTPQPVQAKLTKQQQTFVNNFSPIVSYGFIIISAWCWSKAAGPEYVILQPSDDIAQKITEPLVRIFARHNSFVQSMSPDQIDVGQCIFALFAYVHSSWSMYQQMKAEKQKEEEIEPRYQDGYGGVAPTEERLNGTSNRRYDVQQNAPNVAKYGDDGRNGNVEYSNLTPKQEAERQALSRLSQLDFESRARRSGRFQ